MDNFAGVTALNLDRTVGRNDVADVALSTSVGFVNSSATMDTTVTWKSTGVTGATDSTTVTMNGVSAGADIELAGDIETVTINTTGAASSLADLVLDAQTTALVINADEKLTIATTFTTTGLKKLTTSGDSLVTIAPTLDTATVEVDASAQTAGGTSVVLGTNAIFTGGAGNDVVDATANTTKNVSGGSGVDTIVFTASTNYGTTATKASGFEVIRGSGVSASYNVASLTGITAIEAAATAGTLTFTGVTNQSVTAQNDITTLALTLSDASGTADALTLTINDSDTTAGAITIGDVSVAGLETLNLVTADALATGTAHVVSDFDLSTSLKTINVSGDSDLTLSSIADMATGAKVDASSFAKRLSVTGLDAGDTVLGGSGNDSVSLAYGSLGNTTSFVGGAGDDTLTVTGNGSDMIDADFAAISGVDNIVVTSATSTSLTLAGFAQAALASVDYNTDGLIDITAVDLTDSSTVDASALTSVGIDLTIKVVNGATNGDEALTISGGRKNDVLTVTLDDSIGTTDGAGDLTASITGGNGVDIISITGVSADATDIFTIVSTATSLANADIITATLGGTDLQFDYNGTLQTTAATGQSGTTLEGALASSGSAAVYEITTNIADSGSNTSGTAFAALLGANASTLATLYADLETQLTTNGGIFASTIAGLDSAVTASEAILISIDNGTGTVVLRLTNTTATGNTISAAEIDLVGVYTNQVLTEADFV